VYSILGNLISNRSDSSKGDTHYYDAACKLLHSESMTKDVLSEKSHNHFVSSITNSLCSQDSAEDIYYLINNTFLEVKKEQNRMVLFITLVTKEGNLIVIRDDVDRSLPQSTDISVVDESSYALHCSFGSTEDDIIKREGDSLVVNENVLSEIIKHIGLRAMTTSHMISYVWRHCVQSSQHLSFEQLEEKLGIERVLQHRE